MTGSRRGLGGLSKEKVLLSSWTLAGQGKMRKMHSRLKTLVTLCSALAPCCKKLLTKTIKKGFGPAYILRCSPLCWERHGDRSMRQLVRLYLQSAERWMLERVIPFRTSAHGNVPPTSRVTLPSSTQPRNSLTDTYGGVFSW